MRKLLTSLLLPVIALLGFSSSSAQAQTNTPYTITQFYQFNSNGDLVPVNIPTPASTLGQDFIVGANGVATVNPVVKGNISSSVIASGSAVSLTTATAKNITSLSLTAGTWQLYGYIDYVTASATTTLMQEGFGTTTNSFTFTGQAQDNALALIQPLTTTSITLTIPTPVVQVTLASTTTVYMVGEATFSAGSVTAYGTFFAKQIK